MHTINQMIEMNATISYSISKASQSVDRPVGLTFGRSKGSQDSFDHFDLSGLLILSAH